MHGLIDHVHNGISRHHLSRGITGAISCLDPENLRESFTLSPSPKTWFRDTKTRAVQSVNLSKRRVNCFYSPHYSFQFLLKLVD